MLPLEKLCLEETLDDTPQMRNFRRLFEDDAISVKNFALDLKSALTQFHEANNALIEASQRVSSVLKRVGSKEMPLDRDDGRVSETIRNLTGFLDDINSQFAIQTAEIYDTTISPLNSWISSDFESLAYNKQLLNVIDVELDNALQRYMRLPVKYEDKQYRESVHDVYQMRRKFHNTALLYYSSLNQLQYRRYSVPLNILSNLIVSQRGCLQRCWDIYQKQDDLTKSLEEAGGLLNTLRAEDNNEAHENSVLRMTMDEQASLSYYPELPTTMGNENSEISSNNEKVASLSLQPANVHMMRKSGYLFMRSRSSILSPYRWQRLYFFTQTGNLMCQDRNELVSNVLVDLNEGGVRVEEVNLDDRRNVFQLTCSQSKKSFCFQAESAKDQFEWIATINNIVQSGSGNGNGGGSGADNPLISPSHSIPSAMTPPPSGGFFSNLFQRNSAASFSPAGSVSDRDELKSTSALMADATEQWISTQPVDFELKDDNLCPETSSLTEATTAATTTTTIENPFSSSDVVGGGGVVALLGHREYLTPCSPQALLVEIFSVRLLGSVILPNVQDEFTISAMIRHIVGGRASQNIFKLTELLLVVSDEGLWLLDEPTSNVKRFFPIKTIKYWSPHKENKRLFGLIATSLDSRGDPNPRGFAFECDSGDEISASIRNAFDCVKKSRTHPIPFESISTEKDLVMANIARLPSDGPAGGQAQQVEEEDEDHHHDQQQQHSTGDGDERQVEGSEL